MPFFPTMPPQAVLESVICQACKALDGWWAQSILIADDDTPTDLVTAGLDYEFDVRDLIRPHGISRQVVTSGQAYRIPDVRRALKKVNPRLIESGVRAAVCVPLCLQGKNIGVLWIHYREPRCFDPSEVDTLQLYAAQAAIAYENLHLYQEQRRQTIQLEKVLNIIQGLVGLLDLPELLSQVVTQIQTHLGYDHVHIFLVDAANGTTLEYGAGTGPTAQEILRQGVRFPIGEDGFVGWVAATGEPILCNDVAADPRYRYYEPLSQTLSEISVPLRYGEWVLGVLDVQNERKEAFDESDLFVLQSLADLVAVSIENACLFCEREQRIQELMTLNKISETIVGSSLDMDETLTAIMERVNAVFQVEAGSILLLENGRLTFRVSLSQHAEIVKRHTLAVGQGIAGWVAQHGHPLLVPDARSDPRWCPEVDADTEYETKSILCVPMKTKDGTIGVIEILNPVDGRHFTQDDLYLLEPIAAFLLIAVESAYWHRQMQQRSEEVSMLYTLAQKMTSNPDLPVILDAVVNIVKRVLDCRGCCVFLLDEEIKELRIRAAVGIALEGLENIRMHVGEGVSGRVVQQVVERAKPIYIPDTRQEPDFQYFNPEIRSLLVVPLITQDRVMGTLSVDDLKVNAFSADVGRLLTIAAAQAAVAIENTLLFGRLKERAKKLEEAYTELQEVNRKKDEFVQNVSHELRTPLTPMKSCIENMLSGMYGPLTDKQRARLEIALTSAREEDQLIENLLDLARIQEDRATLELEDDSIAKIVHDVTSVFEYDAHQKRVALRKKLPEEDTLEIMMDVGKVKQILTNLVSNALKFTSTGGCITVTALDRDCEIEVRVEDTGIGIPKQELDKIFDRFYQVDSSLTRKVGGAGIGLNIAREYVEMHRGRIWVQSEVGKGSTFFFTLPKSNTERDQS